MSDLLKVKVGGSSYLCRWEPTSVKVENVRFLLNGKTVTDQPSEGSISQYKSDDTFPIENLPIINKSDITSGGVYFTNDFISHCMNGTKEFTLDFWFKGISHNRNYTPYFIGFSRLNNNDYMLTTNYSDDLSNFLFPPFFHTGLDRFYMEKNKWHHIAAQFKPNGSRAETSLYIDGTLVDTPTTFYPSEGFYLKFNAQSNTDYSLGQICIREGIVWTSDFTPPTMRYIPA